MLMLALAGGAGETEAGVELGSPHFTKLPIDPQSYTLAPGGSFVNLSKALGGV